VRLQLNNAQHRLPVVKPILKNFKKQTWLEVKKIKTKTKEAANAISRKFILKVHLLHFENEFAIDTMKGFVKAISTSLVTLGV
jgi:hypothetical protein